MQTSDREIERDDLDWLAFRYISNELTAAESESFEQRLADDQPAREAVARAVDLAQAVAAAPADVIPFRTAAAPSEADHTQVTTHSAPPRRVRPLRWLVAAAACLVAGVLVYQSFNGSSELRTLAKVWAKRLGQDALDSGEFGLIADDDAMSLDEDDDLTVPSWLIEAVGGGSDSDKWEDT